MTRKSPQTSAFTLFNSAFAILVHVHKITLPLIAAHIWLTVFLSRLIWYFLPEPNTEAIVPYLIGELAYNIVLYSFALGLGILWVRCLFLSPGQAWADGSRAFLQRWGRMLGHFGATVLAGIIVLLCAILVSALINGLIYILMGNAGALLQVPLLLILVIIPLSLIFGALWISLLFEAMDQRLNHQQALHFAFHNWRRILPIMALIIVSNIGLYLVIISIFSSGSDFDPTNISSTIAIICSGFAEFVFILLAITSLALLLPATGVHNSQD